MKGNAFDVHTKGSTNFSLCLLQFSSDLRSLFRQQRYVAKILLHMTTAYPLLQVSDFQFR